MSDLSAKAIALSVIAAVEEGDLDKFDGAFKSVDDEATKLLERFLVETATGRYEMFSKEDGLKFAGNPNFARAVLRAWKRVGTARGKMAARMAFETVINTRRHK